MTHLIVAQKMTERYPDIASGSPQFYLGSLGPDAVHFREGFTGGDKKKSHLVYSGEEWGMITRNDEWAADALAFLRARENSAARDFVYGYIIHILCDICHTIYVWIPFKEAHPGEWESQGRANISHRESASVDLRLSQTFAGRPEAWAALEKAEAFDFEGLVSKDELEGIRQNILYKQYSDLPEIDVSGNTMYTCESQLKFAELAAGFAAEKLGLC